MSNQRSNQPAKRTHFLHFSFEVRANAIRSLYGTAIEVNTFVCVSTVQWNTSDKLVAGAYQMNWIGWSILRNSFSIFRSLCFIQIRWRPNRVGDVCYNRLFTNRNLRKNAWSNRQVLLRLRWWPLANFSFHWSSWVLSSTRHTPRTKRSIQFTDWTQWNSMNGIAIQ